MIDFQTTPNERRYIFHKPGSFLRKVAERIPVIGTGVSVFSELQRTFTPGPSRPPSRSTFFDRGPTIRTSATSLRGCPSGFITDEFGQCVRAEVGPRLRDRLAAIIPGGGTGLVPSDDFGEAVVGAFGIPALEPAVFSQIRHQCPSGMVLGRDMLCYPKAVLRRDSKFRKWRPGPRPLLSGGKRKAIRTARAAILEVKEVAKSLGVTVPKR